MSAALAVRLLRKGADNWIFISMSAFKTMRWKAECLKLGRKIAIAAAGTHQISPSQFVGSSVSVESSEKSIN